MSSGREPGTVEAERPAAAFYCVCDERYFLGAAATLNSLRLSGHTEPVFVLDCGLRPEQRALIAPHVHLVDVASDTLPFLLKTVAPLRHPADVMILIDADMIVTRPLTELIERARHGTVVAFRNDYERFFPEWAELLGLGELRRLPSICSGLALLGGSLGADVIRRMDLAQRRVESDHSIDGRVFHHAFLTLDQDVLNAILCARAAPEHLVALDHRLLPNPPFAGLRVVDERRLRCAYASGEEPYALHRLTRKPWLEPTYHDAYARLFARLLIGDDVPVRVPEQWVPRRMRTGLGARLERAGVNGRERIGGYLRGLLPRAVTRRIDDARLRRRADG